MTKTTIMLTESEKEQLDNYIRASFDADPEHIPYYIAVDRLLSQGGHDE